MALLAAGEGVAGSASFRTNGDDEELQTAAAVAAADPVAPAVAEDWEATCIIYADLATAWQQHKAYRDTEVQKKKNCNPSTADCRGSIDLPLSTCSEITFARPEPVYGDNENPHFRFWYLTETPVVHLDFHYERETNNTDSNLDNDIDRSLRLKRVSVSLTTIYPSSWPPSQSRRWLEWLDERTTKMLEEEENCTSYAICEFVEHSSILDFFELELQYQLIHAEGQSLLVFPEEESSRPPDIVFDVDSFVTSFMDPRFVMRHFANGGGENSFLAASLEQDVKVRIVPFLQSWTHWLASPCPICLESYPRCELVTVTTCGHVFCRDCLSTFLSMKVGQIITHRDNPFRCPECNYGMKVVGFVKQFLTREEMEKVREWYNDLKHPQCWSLPQCLATAKCGAVGSMRKEAIDSQIVFCEQCGGRWCEYCLKRQDNTDEIHDRNNGCYQHKCLRFCRRYLAASEETKRNYYEQKWPWIRVYAQSRINDNSADGWLHEVGGQMCPVCKNGVERVEGCFHIHCSCGAHFCYECGEELHYPFYGTHHCWEKQR